ncbi:MAG: efflux RND transporter permease subunit [Bacteroidaceae bacterium]|nr:efflux RND transporter permease subunit [Bacteroidaceae bacterium]
MLNSIISFSLKHRLLIIIAAILFLFGGAYTAKNMEVDVFPDLNAPTVVIMTEAKGMAAEEVERLVTFPIETGVNGATNVRRVRSSSTTGFSVVWVEFDWGTDIYIARQIVSEKITALSENLPPTVGSPTLGPQSSILGEVMFISLTSDKTSLLDLRTIADWTIRPRLLSTGGVAQVTVLGGDIKEYAIKLHLDKMGHYGISIDEALNATKAMTQNGSGGVFYEYGNEYIVRGLVATNKLEELRRTLIAKKNDQPIMLDDIADVEIEGKSPKMGVASVDGKPSVLLTITKQPNTGTLELTEQLDKAIEEIKQNLPSDIKVRTDLYRQQHFIDSSISNIKQSLFEGAFFVVIVLFLFLMNVRTTFISLITIPLALLTAILTLQAFGMTINTMSIGGMAIAIGSLVDDAIVDVENVYKRLKTPPNLPTGEEKDLAAMGLAGKLRVVYEASKEVRVPILSSTIIIVVSFIPLFFLDGMEGRMLIPLGVAFIVSLFASTAVALTVTPVLCSLLLRPLPASPQGRSTQGADSFIARGLKKVYGFMLKGVMKFGWLTIGATLCVLVYAVFAFTQLGHSFLPSFNEGSLTINISTFPGVSLNESDRIGLMAEKALLKVDGITAVARKTGRAELDEHALGVNVSEIEAILNTEKRSKKQIVEDVRKSLGMLSGVNIEIGQPISHRIDAMLSGTQANIAIKVFGPDLNRLYNIGKQIKKECSDIPGIVDFNVEQQVERPQLSIVPRREMLARYGITMPEFTEFINVLLGGEVVAQVFEGNKSFDLTLRSDDVDERTMESIRQTKIDTKDNEKIPLEYVADIQSAAGPNTINRENVSRKLVVSANVEGRDLGSVVEDIQKRVNQEISLPDDYHIEYGGQFESEKSARQTLIVLSCVAILIIFLLLYQQFNSWKQGLIILFNLPLALIGGVFALQLTGGVLSIPAIIGFISLFGIATRNGMLLVDRYNELSRQGHSMKDAVMLGSLDRLNPIIMTALTSALALIPLALGGDLPGNEIQSPMAKVMLGGLISSTILNGFIIPVVFLKASPHNDSTKFHQNM